MKRRDVLKQMWGDVMESDALLLAAYLIGCIVVVVIAALVVGYFAALIVGLRMQTIVHIIAWAFLLSILSTLLWCWWDDAAARCRRRHKK